MYTLDECSKNGGARPEPTIGDRLKQRLVRVGRPLFTHRLEIGLGVAAVVAPFVRPTLAKKPSELALKAAFALSWLD